MGRLSSRALVWTTGAFSTCLGLGFFPKGSGTVASFFAIGFWLMVGFGGAWLMWTTLVALIVAAGFVVPLYEKLIKAEDSSTVVIDEWIGMGIAMSTAAGDMALITVAFLAFRVFDITKPPGVRFFDQRYLRGWGVTLDDVVAGLYALVVVEAFRQWIF